MRTPATEDDEAVFTPFIRPEIMVFMIPIVAILCGTFIAALKIMRGGSRRGNGTSSEDARIMQDIYVGLQKMEKRIDALETIMVDMERARKREE